MPTATASHSARQRCASRARVLAGDPLRVAGAGGDLAVERHRRLEEHERAAGAGVLAERLVEQAGARGELAVGDDDLDALVAQDPEAAAGGLLGRVVGGDHDAGDAGLEDRVGAGRRAGPGGSTARARRTCVAPRGVRVAAGGERRALGVRPAVARRGSPRRAPAPSRDDDRADQRVRARRAPAAARRARWPAARWARSRSRLSACVMAVDRALAGSLSPRTVAGTLTGHEADHPDPLPRTRRRRCPSRSPTSRARSRASTRSSGW